MLSANRLRSAMRLGLLSGTSWPALTLMLLIVRGGCYRGCAAPTRAGHTVLQSILRVVKPDARGLELPSAFDDYSGAT